MTLVMVSLVGRTVDEVTAGEVVDVSVGGGLVVIATVIVEVVAVSVIKSDVVERVKEAVVNVSSVEMVELMSRVVVSGVEAVLVESVTDTDVEISTVLLLMLEDNELVAMEKSSVVGLSLADSVVDDFVLENSDVSISEAGLVELSV